MSEKERNKKIEATNTFWLFGIHAVRDALKESKTGKNKATTDKER